MKVARRRTIVSITLQQSRRSFRGLRSMAVVGLRVLVRRQALYDGAETVGTKMTWSTKFQGPAARSMDLAHKPGRGQPNVLTVARRDNGLCNAAPVVHCIRPSERGCDERSEIICIVGETSVVNRCLGRLPVLLR
jgi:hypothetical protein